MKKNVRSVLEMVFVAWAVCVTIKVEAAGGPRSIVLPETPALKLVWDAQGKLATNSEYSFHVVPGDMVTVTLNDVGGAAPVCRATKVGEESCSGFLFFRKCTKKETTETVEAQSCRSVFAVIEAPGFDKPLDLCPSGKLEVTMIGAGSLKIRGNGTPCPPGPGYKNVDKPKAGQEAASVQVKVQRSN
jgi:hypothetical protein